MGDKRYRQIVSTIIVSKSLFQLVLLGFNLKFFYCFSQKSFLFAENSLQINSRINLESSCPADILMTTHNDQFGSAIAASRFGSLEFLHFLIS